jgi:hypothetical protein
MQQSVCLGQSLQSSPACSSLADSAFCVAVGRLFRDYVSPGETSRFATQTHERANGSSYGSLTLSQNKRASTANASKIDSVRIVIRPSPSGGSMWRLCPRPELAPCLEHECSGNHYDAVLTFSKMASM